MKIYGIDERGAAELTAAGYTVCPVYGKAAFGGTAEDLFRALRAVDNHVFLLDSADDKARTGRYSFLGFDPKAELTCRDGKTVITAGTRVELGQPPHGYIRNMLAENKSPRREGLPPFTGGLVGYFSYDFIRYSEPSLDRPSGAETEDDGFNDVDLMLFDKIVAVDNLEKTIYYIVNVRLDADNFATALRRAEKDIGYMAELCASPAPAPAEGRLLEPLTPRFDRTEYAGIVARAQKHIREGDIFQVVLSNKLSARFDGSLYGVYRALKTSNPSPYMFYFSSRDAEIAGASPETLVRLERGKLTTYPLAGTRPRGGTAAEDARLERELLADEKELSEHNMLVDLGRNDLGKVSEFGSVKVEEYMNVEKFSCVMHIGSTVSGQLRAGCDALDAVEAVLPAGTLSGAPKLRACEIVGELEGDRRGVYGGAVGYLAFTGDMDTCIAIRLAYKKNGRVCVRSGAGIVADSVPDKEYEECANKAKAIVKALGQAWPMHSA